MLSAQALVTKYDLKASLGHKGNVNKEKHINFFKYICHQLLTLLTVRVGWEALQILGECITRKTGILVIFHEKIATSETYCETFDKTFENETHGSHTEILQAIEDATMNFRKTDTKSLFAFHIFTQVKHLNTVNNLVLSTAIKHKLTMNSDKATELHCITHCMIAPMKPVNGVIAFSIDCNGEPMQSVSSMNFYYKNIPV
ncbi:MAG: hypothetical protein GY941_00685 [Planctomycetes bacterium]|nr:hypothetical protein [Planctomycetota bacterium]